jgi:ABC-type lipoprotein release transport system permease subunit
VRRGPVRAAWLCATKELRRNATSWLALAILFGLLSGAATLAVAGADRTGSAFDRLAARTRAADLVVSSDCTDKSCAVMADNLSTLPSVIAAAPVINYLGAMSTAAGKPLSIGEDACYTGSGEVDLLVAPDGRWGSLVNRFDLAEGTLPDPTSSEQVLVASELARRFGIKVGDQLSLHGDACDQPEGVVPRTRMLRVVGIERSTFEQKPEVGFYLLGVHGTPALFRALRDEGIDVHGGVALRLRPSVTEKQVVREAARAGFKFDPIIKLSDTRREIAKGTRPDSVGALILAMFAAIAALAVVGPALIQRAAASGPELRTLRILGLTRSDVARLGLSLGLLVGCIAALVAAALAIGLSFLSPFGEARRFDPAVGTYVSGLVWVGMAGTVSAVVALVVLGTSAGARRTPVAWFRSVTSPARLVRSLRLRPAMATGVRMALELRGNATSILALVGVFVGAVGLVAALAFGSSLAHFDRTPSLVGWNWDVAVFLSGGDTPPTPRMLAEIKSRLLSTPGVDKVSLVTFFPPQFAMLDVESYPMAFSTGVDSIRPTVISGRAPSGPSDVLLNPILAKRLGAKIGDRLDLRQADPTDPNQAGERTLPFEVVGLGTVPIGDGRIQNGLGLTLEGLGSLAPDRGPDLAVVRLAPGADVPRIRAELIAAGGDAGSVIDRTPSSSKLVQLDTQQVAATPRIAAGLFGVTAAAVLMRSVISAGRRRRRELAILRTLGLTSRQATLASVWHGVTSSFIAVALSVPVGLALGSRLWALYAQSLGVKVESSAPGRAIAVVVASGIVGAAAVAFLPGWNAARRATAAALRAE